MISESEKSRMVNARGLKEGVMVLKDGKVAGWLSQWAFCRRYSTWGNRLKMDFMMIVFFCVVYGIPS